MVRLSIVFHSQVATYLYFYSYDAYVFSEYEYSRASWETAAICKIPIENRQWSENHQLEGFVKLTDDREYSSLFTRRSPVRLAKAKKKKRRSGSIITGSGGVAVASLFKLAALFIKQLIIVNCAPRVCACACFSRVKYRDYGWQWVKP